MTQKWNELIGASQEMTDLLANVLTGLRNNKDAGRLRREFQKTAKNLCKSIDEFRVFVKNPEAIEIELPFDSKEFREAWDYYKYFLEEAFGLKMESTVENKRLQMLNRFAGKSETRAIEILDYLIASRYKNIFKPAEKQISGETTPENEPISTGFNMKKEKQM